MGELMRDFYPAPAVLASFLTGTMQYEIPLTPALSPSDGERFHEPPRLTICSPEPGKGVWCPRFSVSPGTEHPKGWTPNARFMGREYAACRPRTALLRGTNREAGQFSLSPSDGERAGVRGLFQL